MRRKGLPKEEVLSSIRSLREKDVPWSRVLNSICTRPHPLAVEAFQAGIDTNLGDVRIFRGTHDIERRAVALMGTLLGKESCAGSLVSGGTEANLLAMYVARKLATQRRGGLTGPPEVIVAETVHYSVQKIFDLLGLTPRTAPVDKRLRMDVKAAEALVNERTIALIGTAGTSEFGSVDPIEALSQLALERDLYLHVDAATGGFIIPFARELGHPLPRFDFSLPGVTSITLDPHKYGLVNVPAGAVFFRDPALQSLISLDSFFARTPTHRTFLGTRPGGAALATYAVLEHLGWEGFVEATRTNYDTMGYLLDRLNARGYSLLLPPELNIAIVDLPAAVQVMELLERWDWIISVSKRYSNCLRLVVTAHVTRPVVDAFIDALDGAMTELGLVSCGTD
ncbi:tyrosine decarboxylase MfnA [Myxococcus sp. K15C18031901]|uniref:tyrosine decarboxylase MfnA n=1 Tax=Myxococcus dinghuensis TaxID=2906761 RepID=UPI0020A71550|nr:tyrosine decarboxylase MfnA [Myxococcus dinghuensis]MCP3098095.1 tyrosine decarboxylase MfnA [Myxococcus dinghuensis]